MSKVHEIQEKIDALESKSRRIRNQAQGRAMTQVEKSLLSDIDVELRDLQDELKWTPVNGPVTRPGPVGGFSPISRSGERPFSSFGEQMSAVMRAGIPGGRTDDRLHILNAATGLGESVSSDGGFLVQSDFSEDLLKGIFQTGKLAKLCNRVQISGNSNSIKLPAPDEGSRAGGSRWGGIVGYWVDEADEKTASKPKFRRLELTLKKLVGLCYATDELREDVGVLETVLRQGFADEFGFLIDDAIYNGTGAGQPLGFMNSGALVTVSKESEQPQKTLVYQNILNMWARMLPGAQERAVWLCNVDVLPQLYSLVLEVGTGGGPVFLPASGASSSPYASLMGRPLIPVEQAATCGTVGDICLADLGGGYILAEKGGLKSDMSIHVRFIHDESCFRFVLRVDGQPVLAQPVTPFKGENQLSHFVALETRD